MNSKPARLYWRSLRKSAEGRSKFQTDFAKICKTSYTGLGKSETEACCGKTYNETLLKVFPKFFCVRCWVLILIFYWVYDKQFYLSLDTIQNQMPFEYLNLAQMLNEVSENSIQFKLLADRNSRKAMFAIICWLTLIPSSSKFEIDYWFCKFSLFFPMKFAIHVFDVE